MQTEIALERNNSGHLFIGATDFDEKGYGIRTYVLSHSRGEVHDSVMIRRYHDFTRLTAGNVIAIPYEGD